MIVEELVTRLGIEVDTGALAVLEKFRSGVSNALMGLAAVAAGVGTAFVGAVSHAAHAADEMGDLAEKLGVNAEALQELRVAAELSDVSFESLTTGMKFLAKNAAEAAHGSAEAADAFKGIVTKDAKGQLLTADALLMNVAKRFESIKDPAEKMRLAMKLGGRGGAELIPMLNRGAEGIAAFRKEAQEMGVVFGQEALEQADEFGRELVRVKFAMKGLRNTFAVPFFKVFVNGVKLLVSVLKQLRPAITDISKGFADAGARMASVFGGIARTITVIRNASGVFGDWLSHIFGGVQWIKVLEATLIGLGVVFVATAAAAIGAWLAAAAPFILLSALIGFIVDDIRAFIQGGDSVIGRIQKWADAVGDPNEHPIVKMLRKSVSLMMDFTDEKHWRDWEDTIIEIIKRIVGMLPGGSFLANAVTKGIEVRNKVEDYLYESRDSSPARNFTAGSPYGLMRGGGYFRSSAPAPETTNNVHHNTPNVTNNFVMQVTHSVEETQQAIDRALSSHYSNAMPATSGGGNGS